MKKGSRSDSSNCLPVDFEALQNFPLFSSFCNEDDGTGLQYPKYFLPLVKVA